MILVTGAAGKTGLTVLATLKQRGAKTRAFVKDDDQILAVRKAGAAEVVVGDLLDSDVWRLATTAVSTIYHIAPNMHPQEVRLGQLMIAAARAIGNCRVVYHSVLHPQIREMPHHWSKLKVENVLFDSGLTYTVLQPTAYMQNLLAYLPAIQNDGILPVPYPAETRLSLVDLQDVATVAAKILTEPGHEYATYELVGTMPLSQTAVADTFSQILQRPVEVRPVPLKTWKAQARAKEMNDFAIKTAVSMFTYYAQSGMAGNPHQLRYLLGQDPTSLATFIKRTISG
ncbi:SDR family oxidoreductase [Candidatus Leptofilum sp.]|uniref:SDR family oxidoreductase n=1 Tax=Candidatus Leptofilum sp. TaxID=3241576 RepID=UPI003B5B39AE